MSYRAQQMADHARLRALFLAGIGVLLLLWAAYLAWQTSATLARGTETLAEITKAERTVGWFGTRDRKIAFQWTDMKGQSRTSALLDVSPGVYNQIVRDGEVIMSRIKIKYLNDDPSVPPLIMADSRPLGWHGSHFVLVFFSLLFFVAAIRTIRSARKLAAGRAHRPIHPATASAMNA